MNIQACKLLLPVVLAGSFLSGCASVPMASLEQDAVAKTYKVQPGKSNIYVYRNENFGGAIKLTLLMDGKLIGDTAPKTYYMLEVDPGRHSLLSKAENDSVLDLNTETGRNYFVWQEVKMGLWQPRSQLQQVDDAAGKAALEECKRASAPY